MTSRSPHTPRYVRPTLGGWFRPAFFGPWLGATSVVTAFCALGLDLGLFGKVVGWSVGMLVASIWATAYVIVLLVTDVLLLAVRVRTLPTGRRAWATSVLAPALVLGAYRLVPPHGFYKSGPWAVLAAALAPMLVVALVTRLVAGARPPR